MKKIFIFLYWLAFLMLGGVAHASWNDASPADSEYVYKVPGDIRSNLVAIETGTDPALCLTTAKICSSTLISDLNLAAITDSSKVSGAALYNLSSTPSGAGGLPITNGGTGQTSRQAGLNALAAVSLSGTSGQALVSNGTNVVLGYPSNLTIASTVTGDILYYNGSAWVRLGAGTTGQFLETFGTSSAPAWALPLPSQTGNSGDFLTTNGTTASWGVLTVHGSQTFTSSGTFTNSTGKFVTVVIVGGGGGGASGDISSGGDNYAGGGGASGGAGIVAGMWLPAGSTTITIGGAGAGGSGGCGGSPSWSGCGGGSGGTTSFGSLITATGGGGGAPGTGVNQGGGGTGGGAGSVSVAGVASQFSSTTGTYTGTYIGSGGTLNSWQQSGGNMCGDNCNQGGQGGGNPWGVGSSGTGGNASNATGFGAGGGGSGYGSSYTAGNGTPGEVIVYW